MRSIALPLLLIVCALPGLVSCAVDTIPSTAPNFDGAKTGLRASGPVRIGPELKRKILALDPERISEEEVAEVLAQAPAPQIIGVHGGIYPVHLLMRNFSSFAMRMGYPGERVELPGGYRSYSCYMHRDKISGAAAWYYEQTGLPVIMIGHSQGGMQVVKTLHNFAGTFGEGPLRVWNPEARRFEDRTEIIDPMSGARVPVADSQPIIYASASGGGGLTTFMPNQWIMMGRNRRIPDSARYFTGYFVPFDFLGGGLLGPSGKNRYRGKGDVEVRNFKVSFGSEHVTVPLTKHLAEKEVSRQWINSYHPSQGDTLPAGYDGPRRNLLWAANVWFEIKKYWCISLQEYVRRGG